MVLIREPGHGVLLDDLYLMVDGGPVTYPEGFTLAVMSEGTEWGNGEPVTRALLSLMSNGSFEVTERLGNRSPVLVVEVVGDDPDGLIAGEEALQARVGRPIELGWLPPLDDTWTVFDVVNSRMDHRMDDQAELHLTRYWSISLSALPRGRSAKKVITPAVSVSSPVTIDDCNSMTGWEAYRPSGAVLSVVSGALRSTYDAGVDTGGGYYGTSMRRTFSTPVDLTGKRIIAVDWRSSLPVVHGIQINDLPQLGQARRESIAGGWTRSYYQVPADVTSLQKVDFGCIHPLGGPGQTFEIADIKAMPRLPFTGTSRQQTLTIDPVGSVPAEGTIIIGHPTHSLGSVLVHSHPFHAGYSPMMRPYFWNTGPGGNDTNSVSGKWSGLTVPNDFAIPSVAVPPGKAVIWARIACSAAGPVRLRWSLSSYMGGSPVSFEQTATSDIWVETPAAYQVYPIALVSTPPARTGLSGAIAGWIKAESWPSGADVAWDEMWLFALDKGALSYAECGTSSPASGGGSNRLWIDAPTGDAPAGGLFAGVRADRADSRRPGGKAFSHNHEFAPGGSIVTVVTSNAVDAEVSLEHYPRGHTHAPRVRNGA